MSSYDLPAVSVVVPCFNVEAYVREAVESAVGQTHKPLEVICVNDGSTDGTLKVLLNLEDQFSGIVRILTGEKAGANVARNRGLRAAKGEFIQFLDADDYLTPAKIDHQLKAIAASGVEVDIVASNFVWLQPDGRQRPNKARTYDVWRDLSTSSLGTTSPNLWRTDAVRLVGGWRPGLKSCQEYDLMFRMVKDGAQVLYDDSQLTVKRERAGSITSEGGMANLERRFQLNRTILEEHEDQYGTDAEFVQYVLEYMFKRVRQLWTLNPDGAERLYEQYIGRDFTPTATEFNTPPFIVLYKLLGYGLAERFRWKVNRMRRSWGTGKRGKR